MNKIEEVSGITINYITLWFILSTYMIVSTGAILLLHHIDKMEYQQHLDMMWLMLKINYYVIIGLTISLFTKIIFMIARSIRKKEDEDGKRK